MQKYHALGLMSGSSLDGLDIAYCRLEWDGEQVANWELQAAQTLPYSEMWQARLKALPVQDALAFAKTHTYFGYYMGELVNQFVQKEGIQQIDYIASHGHTIFHEPDRRYTSQIGQGGALAATTGQRVIADFRTQDVACGGEGAPLAPLADAYLFSGYDFYLNLGGIANLSAQHEGQWLAFDVAPANQVLNALAGDMGLPYDADGQLAASGQFNEQLYQELVNFPYYKRKYPKSMGNEWIRQKVLPILDASDLSTADQLATCTTFIARQLQIAIQKIREHEKWPKQKSRLLVSGGGAFNTFLMYQIKTLLKEELVEVIIPERDIVDYKEALLMALLGLLRLEGVPNSWPAVTGAKRPTINGAVYV